MTLDYVADVVEGLRRAALPSGLDRDAAASFTNGQGRGALLSRSEGMWLARDVVAGSVLYWCAGGGIRGSAPYVLISSLCLWVCVCERESKSGSVL